MNDVTGSCLADLLNQLANGQTIKLGEFGDNASSTDVDEQAEFLRNLADELNQKSPTTA